MTAQTPAARRSLAGILCATGAFLIWGSSPAYWKAMQAVPALEIVLHRVVWSFVFLLVLTLVQRRWAEFVSALGSPRTLLTLSVTTLLVSANWLLYIWAVNAGYLLQASLGYYINPLVNVLLGVLFLKERLRRPQAVADCDYLIVGAGSAGCVLAERLSRDGRHRVTVLEAGGNDRHPYIKLRCRPVPPSAGWTGAPQRRS